MSETTHTETASLVDRLMNELERQMHERLDGTTPLDRAMADAWIRGAGYLKFNADGTIEHVLYDVIHRTDEDVSK